MVWDVCESQFRCQAKCGVGSSDNSAEITFAFFDHIQPRSHPTRSTNGTPHVRHPLGDDEVDRPQGKDARSTTLHWDSVCLRNLAKFSFSERLWNRCPLPVDKWISSSYAQALLLGDGNYMAVVMQRLWITLGITRGYTHFTSLALCVSQATSCAVHDPGVVHFTSKISEGETGNLIDD